MSLTGIPARRLEQGVLAAGVVLRLYLALVNGEANDDHLTVIRIIARRHRLPRLREAWEGFQPKLYHVTVAALWKLSPWQGPQAEVLLAQLVSCAAAIGTLLVLYRALARRDIAPAVRLLTFAFLALNPTLIGLSAQATNDAFVILFSTIALAAAVEFLRSGARRSFLVMSGATVLAALSKGNALVVFAAITGALVWAIIRRQDVPGISRRRLAGHTAAFVMAFLLLTAALGSYVSNWKDTGNPFATNAPPQPFPHLFKRTTVYRSGVTSIADAYFTFRLVDMLEHPAITHDPRVYPLHRTSLWSQLYGRAHFAHFSQHPPSWSNTGPLVLTVGRLILVLALLPTALLVAGMARVVARALRGFLARPAGHQEPERDLHALIAAGFVAFMVVYTLTYRDFSTMKAEFLFPALLPYARLFADEVGRADDRWAGRTWLRAGVVVAFAALLVLYVVDVAILAVQLT